MNAPGDVTSTHAVAILNWNRALLYQDGVDSHHYFVRPSIVLPPGGNLARRSRFANGRSCGFRRDAAQHARRFAARHGTLRAQVGPLARRHGFVELDAFADLPQDLDVPSSMLAAYRRLPAEAFAMYRSRHFADYHALLTLSDPDRFPRHRTPSIERQPRRRRFFHRSAAIAGRRGSHLARVLAFVER